MKYWQKIYLWSLSLFLLALYAGTYLVAAESYGAALSAERERAYAEQGFIADSLSKDIAAVRARNADEKEAVRGLWQSYAGYFYAQGLRLALRAADGTVCSNLPAPEGAPGRQQGEKQAAMLYEAGGVPYLYVEGNAGDTGYSVITARAETELVARANALTRTLVIGSAAIAALLSVALVLVLRRLTQPLRTLTHAAGELAAGNLGRRVSVKSRDETGELAQSFNGMAETIERQIADLTEAAQARQRFIDGLAHEMRTPLTAIHGYAQYLAGANTTEDERLSALFTIEKESARLAEVSDKLLTLARLRHDKPVLRDVGLKTLFEELLTAFAQTAAERGVTLHADAGGTVWRSDGTLLYMLFSNLVQNALRACRPGGSVSLAATEQRAVVRDDGCGMAEQTLLHIAEPFYRADAARSRREGGAGLGLSVCARIAERLGLSLSFESAPEKGTAVTVTFLQAHNNSAPTP